MALLDQVYTYIATDSITLVLICIATILCVIGYQRMYSGFPPGPWGLPLCGYLYFLTNRPFEDFVRMTKKYGDVFSIKIGSRSVVVLNHFDAIKETFIKEADIYEGKPVDGIPAEFGDYKSLFVTDKSHSKEQRRFILKSMRDFGFGTQRIEERIREEAKMVIEELTSLASQPLDVRNILSRSVANIISCLLFDKRFEYEDEDVYKSVNLINEVFARASQFSFLNSFPVLRSLIPDSLSGLKEFIDVKNGLYKFIDKQIQHHRKTFDENNIRDIIDTYLIKGKEITENGNKVEATIFTDDYIRANATLLFTAGTDTTSSTLAFALKLVALYPKVQIRIQKEIDDVIGRERLPSMKDRSQMPYTEATIIEVERFISHLPLTFYHRIAEDTVLRGYKIPKNTFVLANLWSVHFDSRIWKDPYEFGPDRFLKENDETSKLRDYVIPFSIGKRNCLGESLARMEIFLFLTSFLQAFTFHTTTNDNTLETLAETPTRKLKSCCLRIKARD